MKKAIREKLYPPEPRRVTPNDYDMVIAEILSWPNAQEYGRVIGCLMLSKAGLVLKLAGESTVHSLE